MELLLGALLLLASGQLPTEFAAHGAQAVPWQAISPEPSALIGAPAATSVCAPEPPRRKWQAVFEMTMLKPRFSDGNEESSLGGLVNYHLSTAPRVSVGLGDPNVVTFRARYWLFDHESDPGWYWESTPPTLKEVMVIRTDAADLELARQFSAGNWQIEVSGGARYASLEQALHVVDDPLFAFKRAHAMGPTLAVESRLQVFPSWQVFAGLRASALSGEARWFDGQQKRDTDDVLTILEMQIGAQWVRRLPGGGQVFLRGGWEQQVWLGAGTRWLPDAPAPQRILAVSDYDLAFMGFMATAGLAW